VVNADLAALLLMDHWYDDACYLAIGTSGHD
jgi:hypothetical protein